MTIIRCIVCLCLLIVWVFSMVNSRLPGLYIQHIQFWIPSPFVANTPTGYTMNATFRSAITAAYGFGLAKQGFKRSTVNSTLSFISTVTAFTTSLVSIKVNPMNGGQLCYLAYSMVIITEQNNYLQIINIDLNFNFLNNRNRNFNFSYQTFTVSSKNFQFPHNFLKAAPFLTWLITNDTATNVIQQHCQFSSLDLVAGTSDIQITVKSQWNFNNYFFRGVAFILLVDTGSYDSRIAFYYKQFTYRSYQNPKPTFPPDFGVPNSVFDYAYSGYNCIIGLTIYYNKIGFLNLQSYFVFSGSNFDNITNITYGGTGAVSTYGYEIYCFSLCSPSLVIIDRTAPTNSYNCVSCAAGLPMPNSVYYNGTSVCPPCSASLPNCGYCNYSNSSNSSLFCIRCISSSMFLAANNSSCDYCSAYIAHCSKCQNITYCLRCELNYFWNSSDTECHACSDYISGCSTCYNQTYCVSCNSTELFVSSDKGSCLKCADYLNNCIACQSQTNCTVCKNITELILFGGSCWYCNKFISNCKVCISTIACSECMANSFLTSNQYACEPCSVFMPDCRVCSNKTVCQGCFVGRIVSGGCTTVAGCTGVGYFTGLCLGCDSDMFIYDLMYNTCRCKKGNLVGMYCTEVAGCISTQKVGSIVQCMKCNMNLNFIYDPSTKSCTCSAGFFLQNKTCKDYCGDGKVYTNQCDDGNLIDGDGCSHLCKVEVSFRCSGGNSSQPSQCLYISQNIEVNLVDTQKTYLQNQAIFTFDISPKIAQISSMNMSQYFTVDCDCSNYSVSHWTYNDGKAKAYLNYGSNIEGANVKFKFRFDNKTVSQSPIDYNFTVKSKGSMLIVYRQLEKEAITRYSYLGFAFMAILMLLFGSCAGEMAGAELIQVLQTIYYLHFSINQYTQTLSSIQYLSPVALNNLFMQHKKQNYIGFNNYQKVTFSPEYTEITLIGLSSLLAFIATVPFLLYVFSQYFCKRRLQKMAWKIYSKITFPFTLALMFPTYFILNTYLIRNNVDVVYLPQIGRSVIIFASVCVLFLILSQQFLPNFIDKAEQTIVVGFQAKQFYARRYLVYQIFQLVSVWLWMTKGWALCLYVIMAGTLLMIFWQVLRKPYLSLLGNVSILFNQIVLFAYQVYLFLKTRSIIQANESIDIISHLCLILFILVCLILTTIRSFRGLSKFTKNLCKKPSLNTKNLIQAEEKRVFQQMKSVKEGMLEKSKARSKILRKRERKIEKKEQMSEELAKLVTKMKKNFHDKNWHREQGTSGRHVK